MTDEAIICWKCGGSLAAVPKPLSREALCPSCSAYLHVCRMCRFYDTRVSGACAEERAEEVTDKTHMNFCDYFKARPNAHQPNDGGKHAAARGNLDALFGATTPAQSQPRDALDGLFGKKKDED